jgi:hypothetical protein
MSHSLPVIYVTGDILLQLLIKYIKCYNKSHKNYYRMSLTRNDKIIHEDIISYMSNNQESRRK